MAKQYNAGVQEYRATYWQPDYVPLDTDLLACFKITPQAGIDREEAAAAGTRVEKDLVVLVPVRGERLDHLGDRVVGR